MQRRRAVARIGSPHIAPQRTRELFGRKARGELVLAGDARRQHALVQAELHERRRGVLRVGAAVEDQERVGVGRARLHHVRREIGRADRVQVHAGDAAAVRVEDHLEPVARVGAERVVGDEEVPALRAAHELRAQRRRQHRQRTRLPEADFVRLRARHRGVVRPDRDVQHAGGLRVRRHRVADRRRRAAEQHVDFHVLDQATRLALADGRLRGVVADDELVLHAAAPVRLLDREPRAGELRDPADRERPRQRVDVPEPNRRLHGGGAACDRQRARGGAEREGAAEERTASRQRTHRAVSAGLPARTFAPDRARFRRGGICVAPRVREPLRRVPRRALLHRLRPPPGVRVRRPAAGGAAARGGDVRPRPPDVAAAPARRARRRGAGARHVRVRAAFGRRPRRNGPGRRGDGVRADVPGHHRDAQHDDVRAAVLDAGRLPDRAPHRTRRAQRDAVVRCRRRDHAGDQGLDPVLADRARHRAAFHRMRAASSQRAKRRSAR